MRNHTLTIITKSLFYGARGALRIRFTGKNSKHLVDNMMKTIDDYTAAINVYLDNSETEIGNMLVNRVNNELIGSGITIQIVNGRAYRVIG